MSFFLFASSMISAVQYFKEISFEFFGILIFVDECPVMCPLLNNFINKKMVCQISTIETVD